MIRCNIEGCSRPPAVIVKRRAEPPAGEPYTQNFGAMCPAHAADYARSWTNVKTEPLPEIAAPWSPDLADLPNQDGYRFIALSIYGTEHQCKVIRRPRDGQHRVRGIAYHLILAWRDDPDKNPPPPARF